MKRSNAWQFSHLGMYSLGPQAEDADVFIHVEKWWMNVLLLTINDL